MLAAEICLAICFSVLVECDSCPKEGLAVALHAESEHYTAMGSMSAQASIHVLVCMVQRHNAAQCYAYTHHQLVTCKLTVQEMS